MLQLKLSTLNHLPLNHFISIHNNFFLNCQTFSQLNIPDSQIDINGKTYSRLNLDDVYNYLAFQTMPERRNNDQRQNFKKQCRPYQLVGGRLMYQRSWTDKTTKTKTMKMVEVLRTKAEQLAAMKFVHEGGGMAGEEVVEGHRSRDATIAMMTKYYFWHGLNFDTMLFANSCSSCKYRKGSF